MDTFKAHIRSSPFFSVLLALLLLVSPSMAQVFSPTSNQQLPAVLPPPITDGNVVPVIGSPPAPVLAFPASNGNLPFGKPLSNQPNYPQQLQGLPAQPLTGSGLTPTQAFPSVGQPFLGVNQPFSTLDPSLGSSNQMGLPGAVPFESWASAERTSVVVATLVCLITFAATL